MIKKTKFFINKEVPIPEPIPKTYVRQYIKN